MVTFLVLGLKTGGRAQEPELPKNTLSIEGIVNEGLTIVREKKGVTSYQLFHDVKIWWIMSLIWTRDRNGVPCLKNSIDL